MAIPWFRLLETAIGLTDLARARPKAAQVAAVESARVAQEEERARRALAFERLRQTGEREIGRLRLMTRVASLCWLGTLVAALFSGRLLGGGVAVRVMLGVGWALLLAALVVAFVAQSTVARAIARSAEDELRPNARTVYVDDVSAGAGGVVAPWLIALGLAAIGIAVLIS